MSYVKITNEHTYTESDFSSTLDGKKIVGWQNGIMVGDNKKLGTSNYFYGRSGDITITGKNDDETVEIVKQVRIIQESSDMNEPGVNYFFFDNSTATITGYDPAGPRDVVIPSSINGILVRHIGDGAFTNSQITSVVIPGTVDTIGYAAFRDNLIETLTIPDSVTSIGISSFANNNISLLELSENLTVIPQAAFELNQIVFVHIPSGVVEIGWNAFYRNQLSNVDLVPGGNLRTIGYMAFAENLLTVDIVPDGTLEVGMQAFMNNKIRTVELCRTVTNWGNAAYKNNEIWSVNIPVSDATGQSVTAIISESMFENNVIDTINIPEGVIEIKRNAFANNAIETLILPNSLTTIESSAFTNNSISELTIPSTLEYIQSGVFSHNNLTTITIPSTVTTISTGAFKDNNITTLVIPDSVTTIHDSAFENNSLTSIVIPATLITDYNNGLYSVFKGNPLIDITLMDRVFVIENSSAFGLYDATLESTFCDDRRYLAGRYQYSEDTWSKTE